MADSVRSFRDVLFWFVLFLGLLLFVWAFRDILLPFVVGMALAYGLDPLAHRLESFGMARSVAAGVIVGLCLFVILGCVVVLVPVLWGQLQHFLTNFPAYQAKLLALWDHFLPDHLRQFFAQTNIQNHLPNLGTLLERAVGIGASVLLSVWSGGIALVNMLSLVFVTPMVAFYLLKDWDRIIGAVDRVLPRHSQSTCRALARDIDETLAAFIRGQGTLCLTLGLFYAIGLSLAGLNFALLIGFLNGFLSFVPFLGVLVGGTLALGVALVQFWPDWPSIVVVAVIFLAGQALEGQILQPLLVGERVGVPPVWLIFALFAFGYLFGFLGVLLAVPLAAILGVFVRFALSRYFHSTVYLGKESF